MIRRRAIIKAIAAAPLIDLWAQAQAAFGGFSPSSTSSGSSFSTFSIVNDSGSSQAANVPTQTFGLLFADGDVAAGAAPVFKDGSGNIIPYSYGLLRYYPSGCLLRGTFMLLLVASVAGNGTLTVNVSGGGSWPAQGSGTAGLNRTLTEVYANSLSISATAASALTDSGTGCNLSGNLGAWLNGDTNTYRVVKWLDGPAGTAWRISTNMAASAGAAAHGQLVVDHYITALTTAGSALGGFRWFGAIRQPKYNNNSPAANWRVFDSCTWSENSNTHPLTGLDPAGASTGGNLKAQTFTVGAGPSFLPSITNMDSWYTGTASGSLVPIKFTGSGSLPTSSPQINKTSVWFAFIQQPPNISTPASVMYIYPNSTASGGAVAFSAQSSGTITATPLPMLQIFNRVQFPNSVGRYNFFQGAGAITAETTLRVKIDQAYWQKTKLIPPYMLTDPNGNTIQGASNGGSGPRAVPDTTWSYTFNPYNIGSQNQTSGDVGDYYFLGPITGYHAQDFYNQSQASEQQIRIEGLSTALFGFDFKDVTLDTIPDLYTSGTVNAYTNLACTTDGSTNCGDTLSIAAGTGFYYPASTYSSSEGMVYGSNNPEHKPNTWIWPFLRTGELQFLDYGSEQALGGLLSIYDGSLRNPTSPYGAPTSRAAASVWPSENRVIAWSWREIALVGAFYPYDPTNSSAVNFDGTQTGKYWYDVATENCRVANQSFVNSTYNNAIYTSTFFTGSTSGSSTTLTAGSFTGSGILLPGMTLQLNGVGAGITIVKQLSGTYGLAGTYQMSSAQNLSSGAMSATSGPYLVAASKWIPRRSSGTDYNVAMKRYQFTYMHGAYCWALAALGNSDAAQWLDNFAAWYQYLINTYGSQSTSWMGIYQDINGASDGSQEGGETLSARSGAWGLSLSGNNADYAPGTVFSWTASSQTFSVPTSGFLTFTLGNNDAFIWYSGGTVPGGLVGDTQEYYVRQIATVGPNYQFKLSTTPDDLNLVTPSDTNSSLPNWARPLSPKSGIAGLIGQSTTFTLEARAALVWIRNLRNGHNATTVATCDTVIAALDALLDDNGATPFNWGTGACAIVTPTAGYTSGDVPRYGYQVL